MGLDIIEFFKETKILNNQLELIKLNKDDFSQEGKNVILKILYKLEYSLQEVKQELR